MSPDPAADPAASSPAGRAAGSSGYEGLRLAVALEALHADARTWHTAADELTLRGNHAAGLVVPAAPFSSWAIDAGFPALYERARTQIETLLTQAGGHFDAIATTLSAAAETYRREDEQGAHRFGAG